MPLFNAAVPSCSDPELVASWVPAQGSGGLFPNSGMIWVPREGWQGAMCPNSLLPPSPPPGAERAAPATGSAAGGPGKQGEGHRPTGPAAGRSEGECESVCVCSRHLGFVHICVCVYVCVLDTWGGSGLDTCGVRVCVRAGHLGFVLCGVWGYKCVSEVIGAFGVVGALGRSWDSGQQDSGAVGGIHGECGGAVGLWRVMWGHLGAMGDYGGYLGPWEDFGGILGLSGHGGFMWEAGGHLGFYRGNWGLQGIFYMGGSQGMGGIWRCVGAVRPWEILGWVVGAGGMILGVQGAARP